MSRYLVDVCAHARSEFSQAVDVGGVALESDQENGRVSPSRVGGNVASIAACSSGRRHQHAHISRGAPKRVGQVGARQVICAQQMAVVGDDSVTRRGADILCGSVGGVEEVLVSVVREVLALERRHTRK